MGGRRTDGVWGFGDFPTPWYKFYRSSEHGAQVRYVSSGGGASRSLPPPCGVPWMLAQRFFGCCDHQTSPLYHLDRVQN